MARERERDDGPETSLLNRRNYLRATGAIAGGIGLGVVGSRAASADTDPSFDVISVTVDDNWKSVPLSGSHADPVVLSPSLSYRGPQPATVRLREVADASFEMAIEEWLHLDGPHRNETVGCVATDPGEYQLESGAALEVGRARTNHRWESVTFSTSFSTTPVVFSQAQTVAGPQPITTRNRGVSNTGLAVRVQEEEAQGPHRNEDLGYLAVEPGLGTLDGREFEANTRPDIRGAWQTIEFASSYRQPIFLADLQTFRGSNTCGVRYRNLTESSVEVKIEEERSADRETAHLGERVGYLVVEGFETETSDDDTAGDDETREDTPLSELDRNRVEQLVHEYINDERADHGLDPLAFDDDLRQIARSHSQDMAENDYFSHDSPSGESMSDRYDRFGYDCRADAGGNTYYTGAENIAYTYYGTDVTTDHGTVRYTTADELAKGLVRSWMTSEGHRENILMNPWQNEGIGIHITSNGKVYATQNFC